jgi:Secretion system C-terminal sorting domain
LTIHLFFIKQPVLMLKKFTLSIFFLSGITLVLQAQQLNTNRVAIPKFNGPMVAVPQPAKLTGFEPAATTDGTVSVPPAQSMLRTAGVDELGGASSYDLFTNGCEQNRLHVWPNGEVSMSWTTSPLDEPESTGWPNRGSGYNRRSAWSGGTVPDSRIETTRTGFTNHVVTADGKEHIFSHRGNGTGKYLIRHAYRAGSAATWTETDVPTTTSNGQLWCKAAADGNNIHMIAVTTPTGTFGGTVYRGMDGHVLYYRSTDSGQTWNISDGVIPGLDSSAYLGISGDSYHITAKDGVVAVGVFESWADIKLFKSTDNGTTWATSVINDFPFDKMATDTPYDPFDPPAAGAPNNDPYAIQTCDEKGSLVIDPLGNVHCFYGFMWVRDSIYDDASSNFYPGTNGIVYWRETDPTNPAIIAGALDVNGDGAIDIGAATIPAYNLSGISSMPSASADDNGGIYCVYSAIVENLIYTTTNEVYRHTYLIKSTDFGDTFQDPLDMQYLPITDGDSTLAYLTEAVYPSAVKNITSAYHYSYQRDYVPGSGVRNTGVQDDQLADIIYYGSSDIVDTRTTPTSLPFKVVPNPASNYVNVQLSLEQSTDVQIQVIDLSGSVVRAQQAGTLVAGSHQINVPVETLPNGAYFMRIIAGQQSGVRKLLILK